MQNIIQNQNRGSTNGHTEVGAEGGPEAELQRVESPILPTQEAYGCQVNNLSVTGLFAKYSEAGFLYPAKWERLLPYMSVIQENWRKALEAGDDLLRFNTFDQPSGGTWGSVCSWRSTLRGSQSQHLVSIGGPIASRAAMLADQADRIHNSFDQSQQMWFRPNNRFPMKVFGSMTERLGDRLSSVRTYDYVAVPGCGDALIPEGLRIVRCTAANRQELYDLAVRTRGEVYAKAEELNQDDIELEAVNELYSRVGLSRYRRVWMVYAGNHAKPVGAVLAYRGPLGFNLSFLENRCDLLISPDLSASQFEPVTKALIAAASSAYQDFLPGQIPVTAEAEAAIVLTSKLGGEILRQYCQGVWLRDGFVEGYHHVEHFYDRIVERFSRSHFLAVG